MQIAQETALHRPTVRTPALGLTPLQFASKRALDVALAFPMLLLCAPLWVAVSLWIRCTSPGPALFRQRRVGFRGRRFMLWKFRTMVQAGDGVHRAYTAAWIRSGEDAPRENGIFKLGRDERITGAGRFLRKYSLDELPQLLNVLRGEMSLVGPRPAMEYEAAEYEAWQYARFDAPAGITGLWQVSGRNCLSFARMVELDLQYIREWSLLGDVRILLRTIPAVLGGTGH